MGEWYDLRVGAIEVTHGKNYVDPLHLMPFQRTDLRRETEHPDDDEYERRRVWFEAPARVVGRRLDLLGYTLKDASASYDANLPYAREGHPGYDWSASLQEWQRTIRSRMERHERGTSDLQYTPESAVWEDHAFGFPGGSLWAVVRALVDAHPDDAVTLDLSSLVNGGWLHDEEVDTLEDFSREPVIILTEGKSDARLLREAVDTLYAEYSEFLRFIDYDFAKAAGGVAEVVRFVKMFAGCGIKNRIVALFDNDTAGHEARSQLGRLPPNVFPLCLPSMPNFKAYPTLGPDGPGMSDIDGRACSLELYLGQHALSDEHGAFRPVRWTGYNDRAARHQGEVSDKGLVQARFEAQLEDIRANPTRRSDYDLSGIEAVFEAILAALATPRT